MITYTTSLDGISPDKLKGFFVGWQDAPFPEIHLRLLENSSHVVLALDDETGRVVGYVTAMCDHVLSASVPFLEVLPDFQGHGVGEELVRRILEEIGDLYMIDFVCHPNMQPFYARLGMRPSTGMMRRNPRQQSGAA
jgi:GNAT superfamily N-acetyltransferase